MRWSVVVVAAGCATPPAPVAPVVVPPPAPVFPQPFAYSPEGEPLRYNEPLPAPVTTPFDDVVIAATKTTPDPRLFRACATLATIREHLEPSAVELAWSWNGVIEPPPKPIVMRADDPAAVIAALGSVPPGAHIGIAHAGDMVVVAVTTPKLATAPFDRAASADRGFAIDAKLEPAVTNPQIDVDWDDRSVQRLTPTVASHAFQALVPCLEHRGHGQMSILGLTGTKFSVLAQFPVWCGVEPPRTVMIDPLQDSSGDVDADHAARRLFTLLQRERVTSGIPPLVWDDATAATARQHAEDLHTGLTNNGSIPQSSSKLVAASVEENMAVANSIDDAFTKLMATRDRRDVAMSPAMTGSGVGVVTGDDGRVYVVQIFARTPGTIIPEAMARDLERRIHAANDGIKLDIDLSTIAKELAAGMVAGLDGKKLEDILLFGRARVKRRYVRLLTSVTTTVDLPALDPITLVNAPNVDHVGIAVIQGYHPTLGNNAIWIVTVMARRKEIEQ